ncbi:MAG: FAD-dependent oxidoreductase [Erythrobacter sp.]|nr:FAD-dependent oxidoreductase [Erythrobacter sp.]
MPRKSKHIVLIGGGHAHVAVLADWIRHGLPAQRATLLTPNRNLRYSGMVPGWIAGQYDRDAGLIDVGGLAERAGAQFVLGRCTGLEPDAFRLRTGGGQALEFDIASINTGGIGRARGVLGDDRRLVDIRPIEAFARQLAALGPQKRIAVIGGGAGGTELAFALRNWQDADPRPEIVFVTGSDGLLPEMSSAVRRRARRKLTAQGIETIAEDARLEEGRLMAGACDLEPVDLIVAALGSAAPDWPGESSLATDGEGFILVDRFQRSPSHPHIFAAGDVAARSDREVPHSGVHAVFAGPVLARNLRAAAAGENPHSVYRPRWNNLYLLSTGDGGAIASYGPFAAQGRWVARLKHAIDSRFISKYARLAGTSVTS